MTVETGERRHSIRYRAIWIAVIIALSFFVRIGTSHFIGAHLDDPAWFQFGSYQNFDARAQNIIDGVEPAFFLSDPTRTDLMQYPPAFPLLVGLVYQLTGERSASAVHRVQWPIDAVVTPLLILGVAITAFGWRVGYAAGIFAALSPLLASYGATPSSDAATTWCVLAAVWLILVAAKKASWWLALASGVALGAACWFRVNPLFMIFFWAAAIVLFLSVTNAIRSRLAAAVVLGAIAVVAPIMIRNTLVFHEFALTGLNAGTNLWEGLGETEFGRSQGFYCDDQLMVDSERVELGVPPDAPMTPVWPDGIRRDRERARKSLAVMTQHPVWYAGVVCERMWWMLKIAGDPGPYSGTAGINCTPAKCLAEKWQGGAAAAAMTILGMAQSVYRWLAIPLAAVGIFFAFRMDKQTAGLLAATVLYYLFTSAAAHTELRYVLPMHAVLVVFGGLGFSVLIRLALRSSGRNSPTAG